MKTPDAKINAASWCFFSIAVIERLYHATR